MMSKKVSFKRVLLCALFLVASVMNMDALAYNCQIDTISIDSTAECQQIKDSTVIIDEQTRIIEDIIEAIITVESHGNPKAVNGSCCGAMQISPGMVKTCNKILKEQGSSRQFTLADRFNVEKSKEMFRLFNKKYNPTFNINKAIRSWNGGLGYKVSSTQKYYNKVMKEYNRIHNK